MKDLWQIRLLFHVITQFLRGFDMLLQTETNTFNLPAEISVLAELWEDRNKLGPHSQQDLGVGPF